MRRGKCDHRSTQRRVCSDSDGSWWRRHFNPFLSQIDFPFGCVRILWKSSGVIGFMSTTALHNCLAACLCSAIKTEKRFINDSRYELALIFHSIDFSNKICMKRWLNHRPTQNRPTDYWRCTRTPHAKSEQFKSWIYVRLHECRVRCAEYREQVFSSSNISEQLCSRWGEKKRKIWTALIQLFYWVLSKLCNLTLWVKSVDSAVSSVRFQIGRRTKWIKTTEM